MENKERLRQDILDAEQDVQDLEDEIWNRSRGTTELYEEYNEEELDSAINQAKNPFWYLVSAWDSEYPEEDWYE